MEDEFEDLGDQLTPVHRGFRPQYIIGEAIGHYLQRPRTTDLRKAGDLHLD